MPSADFVTINDQAVRLTSLQRSDSTKTVSIVIIVRGDAARDELTTLMKAQPLRVEFPEEDPLLLRVAEIDLRSTGEGARTIHRFAIALEPFEQDLVATPAESTAESLLMQRLDAIERKLDQLLVLVDDLSTRRR